MVKKVHDRMIGKTRVLIKDTLLLLIEEKGFSSVTVRDLTLKAQINRGTFYLHYLDKYDLIDQIENDFLTQLTHYMQMLNVLDMRKCHQENTPYFPLVQVFQFIKQNGRMLKGLLGSQGDPAFAQKLKLFLKNGFFAEFIEKLDDPTIPKTYFSAFATSAYLGIIEDWLNNDMQQTPEEMAIIYVKIKYFGMKS